MKMSCSEDDDSFDELASAQLLKQLDQYVSNRTGIPVEECRVTTKQKKVKSQINKVVTSAGKYKEKNKVTNKSKEKIKDETDKSAIVQSCADDQQISANLASGKSVKKGKKHKSKDVDEEKMETSFTDTSDLDSAQKEKQKSKKNGKLKVTKLIRNTAQNSNEASDEDIEMEDHCGADESDLNDGMAELKSRDFTGFSSDDELNSSDFDEDSDFDNCDSDDRLSKELEKSEAEEKRQKSIESFKKTVGLTEKDLSEYKAKKQREKDSAQVNWTVPNKYGVKKRPPPEVVVFVPHEKKQREARKKSAEERQLDLRDAKWDVRRFGTSGLDEQNKAASTLEMLVELGATRPKEKGKNYKVLMQEKRHGQDARKLKLREREMYGDIGLVTGNESSSKNKSKKRKKDKNEISGSVFGQIGREKEGAHVVSNRDIKRVKRKGRR